ncbi:MAG: AAA family ATPase [Acidimicrobiales bacterium]
MEQSLPARGRELGLIEDALSSLSSGAGRVVLVSGSAGAGKTTLLRAALGDPVGVRVLSGRAYRFQIPVAFGPIVEALGPSMRADADVERLTANLHSLASLFDGLPLVPPEHGDASLQRPRLLHALHTLIHRMATHGPVAVAIDDAQWADNATVEFLSLLAESVHDVPVAVLLGVRHDDHDANEQATRFFTRVRRDGAAQVTLEPLDAAGVSDVVASVLGEGRVPPELIRLLLERTGGTPLYLVEALSQMQQQGDVTRVGAAWQFNGTRIPPSTFGPDLMAGRLAGSTEDEQEILQMLALHGEPIAETELVALGVDTSRLGPLARRRLVVESVIEGVPRWSLEHPVLADVIVEQLTTTDRQARHERLARLFVTNDPDRFAHHLLGAGERAVRVVGSEVAVARALRSAGELALRRGELIEATDLLTATLGWVREPRPDPLAAAITSELAIAWHDRGHHGIARQLAREAMDECLSIGDVDGALGAAEVLANALFLANIHDQTWIEELAQRVAEEGTDLQRLGIRFRQFAIACAAVRRSCRRRTDAVVSGTGVLR